MMKTMVMQVVPLQPTEDHREADIHTAALGRSHAGAGMYALKEAAAHGEDPTQEQVFWQDTWPMGDPCWSSPFLKDCTPWKGPMLEQFVKNWSLWEGPTWKKFPKDCVL
ncbi:zinc finger and BTB domain-containing protein 5 [Grus japonensis]|uniref:Zinc finger and BTB domain-containing protein 5 n=1 Tax=Grus japonensis TaxID=30415 RepID=A0ABC9WDI3_GRUJA